MQLMQEKISKIFLDAARLYNQCLNDPEHPEGMNYLLGRGFDKDIINRNLFGFVPTKNILWNLFVITRKHDPKEMLELNMLKIDINNRIIDDYFCQGRVTFPIFENGSIICFSSRAISNDLEQRYKTLKYNKIGLFNIDILKNNHENIYISEGVIDTLTLNYLGFPAVGILGLNNFGKEYLNPFLNYSGNIILLFDNDSNDSGKKGIERIGNLLHSNGLKKIFFKTLPRNEGEKKVDVNQLFVDNGFHSTKFKLLELTNHRFIPAQKQEHETPFGNSSCEEPSIYDVASKYMELRKETASRFRGLCPFPDHMDSVPSFILYEESNKFKCYGCGRYGNPYQFLMNLKGISYKEAILEANNL